MAMERAAVAVRHARSARQHAAHTQREDARCFGRRGGRRRDQREGLRKRLRPEGRRLRKRRRQEER
eukprot:3333409-Rhodomonas_salina.1